ncbi:MAG TPA: CUAEP/CCAEP-tail radical SAM protein [Acidimicrobiales bacterium]|nr:CUAEP/CCAEP-tail radical SAM protein [Acidimicrobiales bacterium]
MRVVLVSTYELGHQPLHVASPASALLRAGHDVRCTDLAVDELDVELLEWADAVACSVPMHTAMRLARRVCAEIRAHRPDVALCLYGLYAGLDGAQGAEPVADVSIAGEYEPRLVSWVDGLGAAAKGDDRQPRCHVELGRGRFGLPARHLLPGLDRYAHLALGDERRLAGYVEASHGCAHRCRHCPVPVIYDGRTRLVGEDAVVADVAQLVALGARHVTLGDPDFLNGPHHAARVVDAVHGSFPDITFDATVKVEHILRHRDIWPTMAAAGCLFVVSAFESASDEILEQLDKGHSAADEADAVRVLRHAGIEPRPSLLPFTPWTRPEDVFALLDLVARCDLVGNVDPVQYAIRLLVPPGSLLVSSGRLDGRLDDYDDEHLGWAWRSPDPRLDDLHHQCAALAERAADRQWSAQEAYDAVRAATVETLGAGAAASSVAPQPDGGLRSATPAHQRPRLTEAWFCCAEPSGAQMAAAGVPGWATAPAAVGGK